MKHVKLFEQFLGESAFDAILKYVDNPYGIGADSAEFDQVGRDRQIVFRFADKRDREATRENLKELGIQGKKMSDANAEKGYAYPYELTVFESSVNEAYNRWYIETWYDQDGRKVQLLGSDGTTVTKRPPFDKDVESHHDRITKLRKIKPFLVGDVEYRVVDGQGRTLKAYDRVIEESAVNEANVTVDDTDLFIMMKIDRHGDTHVQFIPKDRQLDTAEKDQLAQTLISKIKGKKVNLTDVLVYRPDDSFNGVQFGIYGTALANALEKLLK